MSSDRLKAIVLVLEDEPLLMMSLVDFAEEAGCAVVESSRTADAVALLEARTDIRLVIADLDVCGSNRGMTLVAAIRDRWPLVELILTSSAPTPPRSSEIPARGLYVNKPFGRREVVAAIQRFTA